MATRRRRRRASPASVAAYRDQGTHRADLIASFRDGQLCPRCHHPMRYWQALDAGHVVSVALGGGMGPRRLEHRSCNRSAGAVLGLAMRNRRAQVAIVRATTRRAIARSKWG